VGGREGAAPAVLEPAVKYHPEITLVLTGPRPGPGPCSPGFEINSDHENASKAGVTYKSNQHGNVLIFYMSLASAVVLVHGRWTFAACGNMCSGCST
jgi:hypothetical protein